MIRDRELKSKVDEYYWKEWVQSNQSKPIEELTTSDLVIMAVLAIFVIWSALEIIKEVIRIF